VADGVEGDARFNRGIFENAFVGKRGLLEAADKD
jgi:hypothetical protein